MYELEELLKKINEINPDKQFYYTLSSLGGLISLLKHDAENSNPMWMVTDLSPLKMKEYLEFSITSAK